jgi:hypothetical protein
MVPELQYILVCLSKDRIHLPTVDRHEPEDAASSLPWSGTMRMFSRIRTHEGISAEIGFCSCASIHGRRADLRIKEVAAS